MRWSPLFALPVLSYACIARGFTAMENNQSELQGCDDVRMPTTPLDRAIYSFADVDRLVGLHAGTARR